MPWLCPLKLFLDQFFLLSLPFIFRTRTGERQGAKWFFFFCFYCFLSYFFMWKMAKSLFPFLRYRKTNTHDVVPDIIAVIKYISIFLIHDSFDHQSWITRCWAYKRRSFLFLPFSSTFCPSRPSSSYLHTGNKFNKTIILETI